MFHDRLTSGGGSTLIADTTTYTSQSIYAFIVQEDTVVATCQGGTGEVISSPAETNFLTEFGISGKTLKQGALFMCPLGQTIQTIKLTSGSIIVYK
jgi:hypothetical protein